MSKAPTLTSLRQRIDTLDTKLHDLLMQRALLVEAVGELKKHQKLGPPFRLGREAEILRRLADRHEVPLPYPVIARLWREIIASFTQLEANYAVAVCQPGQDQAVRDLARDHYGGGVQLMAFAQPGPALAALGEGKVVQVVLPMPGSDDVAPWWTMLMDGGHPPRIVAKLPFVGGLAVGREALAQDRLTSSHSGDEELNVNRSQKQIARADSRPQSKPFSGFDSGRSALVAALFPPEPSGDDVTWLGIETDEPASRSGLKTELEKAGFSARLLAAGRYGARSLALAEVDGFVNADDARITALSLPRILVLGAYARPIPA